MLTMLRNNYANGTARERLPYWLSGHGFCMEAKPVGVIQLKRAHFAKHGSEILSPRGTKSKQVDIASRT